MFQGTAETLVETLFGVILKKCSKQKCITVCWNAVEKNMTAVNKNELTKVQYKSYVYAISALAIMFQILFHEFVANQKIRDDNILTQVVTAYALALFFVSLAYLKVCVTRTSELISFANGLFSGPTENLSPPQKTAGNTNLLQKVNVLFAWNLFIIMEVYPAMMVFGFHLDNPCKSTLLGWWALAECSLNDRNQLNGSLIIRVLIGITKFGVLCINYMIYSHGLRCMCFGLNAINILAVFMLQKNLRRLASSSHQPQHMKDTSIVTTTFTSAVSATFLIQIELTSKNIIAVLFFLVNCMGSMQFLTICVGGVMVPINGISKEFLKNWKRQRCYDDNSRQSSEVGLTQRWLKRFFQSSLPLRIKLGESNFLENLTPLRCIDNVVQITINLLLLD
ncbi:unnamed protein product [Orchesella dallaii]|uniref:Odorant receptor n=1 Tax=Orchesella dallaii TaxID=48710 RepID=A0ABP1PND6_9HEXA